MITIKMKANSDVKYHVTRFDYDDCLLVDNYPEDNQVWHIWIEQKELKNFKTPSSVGMWRVKPTDK